VIDSWVFPGPGLPKSSDRFLGYLNASISFEFAAEQDLDAWRA
jgi:hypothetical protein